MRNAFQKLLPLLAVLALTASCADGPTPDLTANSYAVENLPDCDLSSNDMDGDGKPNGSDVSRDDACDADPYGLCLGECDCATGEGDGLPDCRVPAP